MQSNCRVLNPNLRPIKHLSYRIYTPIKQRYKYHRGKPVYEK